MFFRYRGWGRQTGHDPENPVRGNSPRENTPAPRKRPAPCSPARPGPGSYRPAPRPSPETASYTSILV